MDAVDELLSIRAAELYYEENLTQDEIGRALRITRWKVGRLLTQARDEGFIRIEIRHSRARRVALERRLRHERGLLDAVVVSRAGVESEDELQRRVAQAAADYLTDLRPVPRLLGVSWGRTLSQVAAQLREGWSAGTSVVQLNGGASVNDRGAAAATAVGIAHKGGGQATLLPIPAILERRETKEAIEADRVVASVLRQAADADAYLFSAGAADARSVHVASGYLDDADIARLTRRGAVGDVVGRYVDADGDIVDPDLDARTVGYPLDALRGAPVTIAVTAGTAKHAVTRAMVASGLCKILITDESTALHLLGGGPDGE
ncbi:sugar-binding transcriptional regulator [Microbacterium sp.]|uniref:sugar-binding transcriptional regulator n=1 Tax=Microbacterium sp. TaxID=51671 RepID=UPI0039E5F96A